MAVDYKSFDFQIYEYLIRLDQLLAQAKGLPEEALIVADIDFYKEEIARYL